MRKSGTQNSDIGVRFPIHSNPLPILHKIAAA